MNDMNASFLKPSVMADVQSTRDERALPIEQVGIRGVRHPLTIRTKTGSFPSVGNFEMDVALPAHIKGTHMSRFMAGWMLHCLRISRERTCRVSWRSCNNKMSQSIAPL